MPEQAFPVLAGCPVSGPPWISLGQGAQPWPGPVTLAEGSFLWDIVPCSSQSAYVSQLLVTGTQGNGTRRRTLTCLHYLFLWPGSPSA